MNRIFTLLLFLFTFCFFVSWGQVVVYSDDFNSYSDGTTQGAGTTPKWTLSNSATNIESTNVFSIQSNALSATHISVNDATPRGTAYWLSQSIPIIGFSNIALSVEVLSSTGTLSTSEDLVKCEYAIDGGSWTTFGTNGQLQGVVSASTTASQSGLSGNSVQIRVSFVNDSSGETYRIDNVSVTGTGPILWFKADEGVTESGGYVTEWYDRINNLRLSAGSTSTNQPTVGSSYFNFNSFIDFDGNDFLQTGGIPASYLNSTSNTVFIVQKFVSGVVPFFFGDFNNPITKRFSIEPSGSNLRFDFPNDSDGKLLGNTSMIGNFQVHTLASNSTQNFIYINGDLDVQKTRTSTFNNSSNLFLAMGRSAFSSVFASTEIAEVVIFNSEVTGNALNSWHSYLTLKYGITGGSNGSTFSYVNSNNDVIWTGSSTYNYDIFGIGNDNNWGLDQKVASSVNTSSSTAGDVVVATTNDFTSANSASGRTSLSDGQFLVIGTNGQGISSWVSDGGYDRVGRFWRVQNTNDVGTVNLRLNLTGIPSSLSDYKLVLDNDADLSNGVISEHALTNSSGSIYTCNIDFPNGVSFFTITDTNDPDSNLWFRADAGTNTTTDGAAVASWSSQATAVINANQTTSTYRGTYQSNELNFNPVILLDGTDDRYDLSSTAGLGYGASSRSTFVVARENSTASWVWAWAFSYGSASTNQAWAIGRNSATDRSLVLASYGGDISLSGSNSSWGNNYRLITGEYDGTNMELFTEGNSRQSLPLTLNTTQNRAHIGRQVNNLDEYWGGEIAEVIHFSEEITPVYREKVETYLGLKYGITVEHDYWAGATKIYDVSSFANDIAGIGRDNGFSLNQLISSSQNTSTTTSSDVVVSRSDNFTAANSTSRPALSDEQFLIWGNNGGATSAWSTDGTYNRVARFWKVQNTGGVTTVHVQINLSSYPNPYSNYYLIVDSDNNLSNGITQAYELTAGSGDLYSCSLTFPTGTSYFTIGYDTDPAIAFWLKADSGTNTSTNNANVSSWTSQASNGAIASQTTSANQATFQTNDINFNPSLLFNGSSDYFDINTINNLGYYNAPRSTFVVAKENGTSSSPWGYVWAYGSTSTAMAWGVGAKISTGRQITLATYGSDLSASAWGNNYRLISATHDGTTNRLYNEGASLSSRTFTLASAVGTARIGRQINGGNEFWGGNISEVIHFVGNLSISERQQVESYLGLKYGITLSNNYVSSSATVYDVSSYSNDIAGIGNDTTYGLDQRVSSSNNTTNANSSDVIVATSNDFTSANGGSRTALTNGQYLVWGHNNMQTTSWVTEDRYKRVDRRWKVQNTSSVGAVNIQINLNGYPAASGSYEIIIDNDTDLANGVASSTDLTNSSGDLYTASVTFPSGTSYFTIGYTQDNNDLGDAPSPYPTLLLDDGASHQVVSTIYLGGSVDNEADGQPNSDATGDGSDEDGVTFSGNLVAGQTVTVTVVASVAGKLNAWIDFNDDGDWNDYDEHVFTDQNLSAGSNTLTIQVPCYVVSGTSFARFRFSTQTGLAPTGFVADGEVEDYQVTFEAFSAATVTCPANVTANTNASGCSYRVSGTTHDLTYTESGCGTSFIVTNDKNNTASLNGASFTTGSNSVIWNWSLATLTDVAFFSWDNHASDPLQAERGLNATSHQSATIVAGGEAGNGIKGINFNSIRMNFNIADAAFSNMHGIDVSMEYKQIGNTSGDLISQLGRFTVSVGSNLSVEYKVGDTDGTTDVSSGNVHSITADGEFHNYRFKYDPASGIGTLYVDDVVVWTSPTPTPGKVIQWSTSNLQIGVGLTGYGSSTAIIDNLLIKKYTLTTGTCTQQITVNNSMTASISITGTTTICSGETRTFTASVSGGNAPYIYFFRINGGFEQSGSSSSFSSSSLDNSDNVSVTVSDTHSCGATSNTITMQVNGSISTNEIKFKE